MFCASAANIKKKWSKWKLGEIFFLKLHAKPAEHLVIGASSSCNCWKSLDSEVWNQGYIRFETPRFQTQRSRLSFIWTHTNSSNGQKRKSNNMHQLTLTAYCAKIPLLEGWISLCCLPMLMQKFAWQKRRQQVNTI